MSTENYAILSRAAYIYAEATGTTPAAAVEEMVADPGKIAVVASALRVISPVSPLADELDLLGAE